MKVSTSMFKHFQLIKQVAKQYKFLPLIGCFCCTLILTACAKDSNLAEEPDAILETIDAKKLQQTVAMQDRLDRVGGKLLINNAELCRKQLRNLLGFSVANKYTYSPALANMAAETYGLSDRLKIMNVIEESGAARAGLQHGDILLNIEDSPVPRGINAERDTVKILSTILSKKKSVHVTVLRKKTKKNFTVPLTPACGFQIELGHVNNVNAYSDGNRILITQGMLFFTKSDEELAYVISKEMAHNVLGHAKALQNDQAAMMLIDNLIQTNPDIVNAINLKPIPKKFDIDADTLSLAMALRSDYAIDNTMAFWKRLAHRYPLIKSKNYTAQHPSSSARLDAMPQSIIRIKAIDKRRKALATPKQDS